MQLGPLGPEQVLINRFARKRVPEPIALLRLGIFLDQLLLNEGLQARQYGSPLLARYRYEGGIPKRGSKHGGCMQDLCLGVTEPRDPKQDRLPDSRRDLERHHGLFPTGSGAKDAVQRRLEEFLEDERVAFASLMQKVAEPFRNRLFQDGLHHARHTRCRQWRQLNHLRHTSAAPALQHAHQRVLAVQFLLSAGDQQQDAARPHAPAQILEQLAGGAVGPVHVVND